MHPLTRALQKLRHTFHDDLLIRTSTGYEPLPTGQGILQDLATMFPVRVRTQTSLASAVG
jgi:DNA-binding transcriptional LysR family regulator